MMHNEHTDEHELVPTTLQIRDTFAEAVAVAGGEVRDAYDDGTRLFLRAVLPRIADVVRPGDHVQGGVALRAAGPEILVHPYTFREICTNGAIHAHAIETRRVERVEPVGSWAARAAADDALDALADAVRACAEPEVFRRGVDELRSAAEMAADHALMLMPFLARFGHQQRAALAAGILTRFDARPDPDRSAYGLMNAVTSVARDTRDPEVRWRLEAIGAAIAALPRERVASAAASLVGV